MKKIILSILIVSLVGSCSLDEDLQGYKESNGLSDAEKTTGALSAAYTSLRTFMHTDNQWALQQNTSDESAGPTRGTDWDDGGVWRDLHNETWNSSNARVGGSWSAVLSGLFNATESLSYGPTVAQKAEGTFLRAFYIYTATDLFGIVPIRVPGESFGVNPKILKRTEAIDLAISELEAQFSNLPTTGSVDKANQKSAAALLAKMYLNRGVYKATDADGKPKIPTVSDFSATDMEKVITYCNTAMAGKSLQTNYFDMFAPDNDALTSEAIFTAVNTNTDGGDLFRFYFATLHYNQNPNGWNGFVALTDLYNKFTDPNDQRKGGTRNGLTNVSGLRTGFLVGEQYNQAGATILLDPTRASLPGNDGKLKFTTTFSLTDSKQEEGIRVVKYSPDYAKTTRPSNDFVLLRLADVMLMKAEAMARKGDFAGANTIVSTIRIARGATGYAPITTLQGILDERSRELYWEGCRRTDQIRFGTFLNPVQNRTGISDRHYLIFPVPGTALSTNPNLTQNPGY